LSFLAYPPTVLGGIAVNAGTMFSRRVIVAAPLTDATVRTIRIFNDAGIMVSSITPSTSFAAPFAIAVGNFLPTSDGDELAVTTRSWTSGATLVAFYSGTGTLLKALPSPARSSDSLSLSTLHSTANDLLVLSFKGQRIASVIDPVSEEAFDYRGTQGPSAWYESAFPQNLLVGTGAENSLSTLWRIAPSATTSSISASEREKNIWIAHNDSVSADSGYIKTAELRHLRTDRASDGYYSTDFDNPNESHWVGTGFANFITMYQDDYSTKTRLWNPTFSQRHVPDGSAIWLAATDPSSGLKRFIALSRDNTPGVYTEADQTPYNVFTYADDPALDRLYYLPQRAFLRPLAVKFRSAPDKVAALEATHEMESYVKPDDSAGDYNPRMIANFRDYVGRLYGGLSQINARFGTSFGQLSALDPPRNRGRGAWDAYANDNPFFVAWAAFQRYAVNRRICGAMTESLLAGFPAELVRTHQAPPEGVIGTRFIPMEWTLAGGAGSGQTSYGLFYQDPSNWLYKSSLSGRTMIDISEYNPNTTDAASALAQLRYIRGSGAQVVAHIATRSDYNAAASAAYQSFASSDGATPRLATVGGIGAVRAVSAPQPDGTTKLFNIVSIGHSDWDGRSSPPPTSRPGLLKSINEDGSWEGSVYAQPFHAHVDIEMIGAPATLNLTTQQWDSGTITNLDVGDQIEVSFRASTPSATGKLTLLVLHNGVELTTQRKVIAIGNAWANYRWVLRNQIPLGGIRILLNSGERDTATAFQQIINTTDFTVTVHRERISHVESNLNDGIAHRGGVTFDVLSANFVPRDTAPAHFVDGRSSFSPTLPGASFVNGGWNSMLPQTSIQSTSTRVTYTLLQGAAIPHPGNASTVFVAPSGKKIYKVSFDYSSNYDNGLVVGGVSVPDNAQLWLADQWGHNSGQASISIPNTDWVAFGLFSRASFTVTAYPWLFEASNVRFYYH
jgi:hypothetical protein